MKTIWNALIYKPLYNILFLLLAFVPSHNVGIAVILLTILVRVAIYPLTLKSIKTQRVMKAIEPKLKEIKEKNKDDKQKQAMLTMELYKKEKISPMSGCLPLLIQIPIISTLFFVLQHIGNVDKSNLYSFVGSDFVPNMNFLWLNLDEKSIILAVIVGITQYYTTRLSLGKPKKEIRDEKEKVSFQDDFQRSMQLNMRYMLPVILAFTAANLPGAVALYWVTSNMFSIGQELWVTKRGLK
jgi:YidC/Oxa1 family membrane protein insertase